MHVIENGHVIDPAQGINRKLAVVFDRGKILFVGNKREMPSEFKNAEIIDAAGLYVAPGFIDLHTHAREPGQEYKETLATASRAAAAGGYTTIVAMPNTEPVNDCSEVTAYIKRKGREIGLANVFPAGALTKKLEGKEITEMGRMKEAGAVIFTDDGKCIQDSGVMRKAMEYAKSLKMAVMTHSEDYALSAGGAMNEGENSVRFGLRGIPPQAEEVIVARDIELCALTGTRLHIGHVSTQRSARMIRDAQKRGLPITCEVTPHHLMLTDDSVSTYNSYFKMYPPLRTSADRKALWKVLTDGTVTAVATDHAPHADHEKRCEFELSLNGVVGLETTLPVLLSLVAKKKLSLSHMIYLLTVGPAKVLNMPIGTLQVGTDADITIFSTQDEIVVEPEKFFSKGRNTPFTGMKLKGRIRYTIYHGKIVHQIGENGN